MKTQQNSSPKKNQLEGSLHQDLLEQAYHLAKRERSRPKQASLRRAISSSYYALFHLLINEASQLIVRVEKSELLQNYISRQFTHTNMKEVAKGFASGNPSNQVKAALNKAPIPTDLMNAAKAFVNLQEVKHLVDYDTLRKFTRQETMDFIYQASSAFESWKKIKKTQQANVFLVALLAHKQRGE
jgi:uncharacterized protein (UPF0332 family)